MEKKKLFEHLFDTYHHKVLRLCKGYFNNDEALADDATQDTFMKVWEHLDSFRHESQMSTWLYRITVNTCLLYLRKQTSKKETVTEAFPPIAAELHSADEEERLQKMYRCINRLEEKNKVIILMVLEGISYEEIAAVIGITEQTLRVKIHRIKINLTQCVQDGKI